MKVDQSAVPSNARRIRLLVVQPTSLCNLNCRYCYVPNRRDPSIIDDATLEAAFQKTLASRQLDDRFTILWHAGEPLAAGLAFYQRAMTILARHTDGRTHQITNAVQTNGTLIDDAWCRLFLDHSFSVGVSIDGPASIHDAHRRDWGNRGTHRRVMRGVEHLRDHGLDLHAIAVLTRESLQHPDEMFDFFLEHGFKTVGFNVEEVEGAHSTSLLGSPSRVDSKVSPEIAGLYAAFMRRIFDRWSESRGAIKIRELMALSHEVRELLSGRTHHRVPDETVGLRNLVIAKDGSITTFSPELAGGTPQNPRAFVVGDIRTLTALEDVLVNDNYRRMDQEIQQGVRQCAAECKYFALCGGAFTSNKVYENGTFASTQTVSCVLHRQVLADVVIEKLHKRAGTPEKAA